MRLIQMDLFETKDKLTLGTAMYLNFSDMSSDISPH